VVTAVPTVLKMVGGGATIAVKQDDAGDTISRTIVVTPSSPAKKKDAQSCMDANQQARKSTPDNTGNDRRPAARPTAEGAGRRGGETPTDNNDPCAPKPAGTGKQERHASAGSN